MVGPCREDSRFSWHVAHSWVNVRGFCVEDAEAALDGDEEMTVVFDTIQTQLADPDSMVSQMLKMAPETGRKIRIFLHPYNNSPEASAYFTLAPFYTGIHLYYSNDTNDTVEGEAAEVLAIQPWLAMKTFVHELWHAITYFNNPITDIGGLLRMKTGDSSVAWADPNQREGGFEEAFATLLGRLAIGGEGHYPGRGDYIYRVSDGKGGMRIGELSFSGNITVSDTVIGSLDCLFPMALRHPRAWRAMALTVLRHDGRMDLETFLRHFTEEYPGAARHMIPEYCRPE